MRNRIMNDKQKGLLHEIRQMQALANKLVYEDLKNMQDAVSHTRRVADDVSRELLRLINRVEMHCSECYKQLQKKKDKD